MEEKLECPSGMIMTTIFSCLRSKSIRCTSLYTFAKFHFFSANQKLPAQSGGSLPYYEGLFQSN